MEEWKNFKEGNWMNEVNVRDFIQKNYTSYQGDESFLANKTEKTSKVWNNCSNFFIIIN